MLSLRKYFITYENEIFRFCFEHIWDNFQTSGFSCFTTQKSQVPKVASQPFPPCLIENIELMLQSKQS